MGNSIHVGLLSVVLLAMATLGRAEEPKKDADSDLVARRFALMESRMASVEVASNEQGFPKQFSSKPIFRYTDPARKYVAAAVWKLGDEGRPRAIITTELYRQFYGSPRIVYEYLSLTPTKFTVTGDDIYWQPEASAVEFKAVPGAMPPDASPQRRLLQMRRIAKRFGGHEIVGKERCELRLMPQPIDRYTPSTADGADGAIFLLAFGANPEAALFIESDGKAWSYAVGRLAGAGKISLTIDDTVAWDGPPVRYGVNSSYNASNAAADIPGIAPDGSEIKE